MGMNITLLWGCNGKGGNVLYFNNIDQQLEIVDIQTKEKAHSYRIFEAIRNPLIIQSREGVVSLTEPFGKSEHVINLNTGDVKYSNSSAGTIVVSEGSRFYFETTDSEYKQLFFENIEGKKKLSLIKSLKVPHGQVVGKGFISWFVRSEHRLIIFDTQGELFASIPLDCRDAIFLGEGKNIFCLTESGGSALFDMNGVLLKAISGIGVEDGILSFSYDKGEIYFRHISLSFNLDRFLSEVVDVYAYDIQEDRLSLVGENVVRHGIGFNILVDR